jgi:preprotein translocase subunit SecD
MPRRLWVRLGLVAVVVAVSIWYLYPPKRRINLGLDLQGGIHLVLGVDADKHVSVQTERAADDFKAALERKGVGVKRVAREGGAGIVVELANPATWNDALTVAADFGSFEVRDRDEKAGHFVLAMQQRAVNQLRDDAVRQGVETIRNRVDQFGVAEPTITRQGSDRILIQLPGVQDPERAKELIGKTALLEFKLVDDRTTAEQAQAGRLPDGAEILYQRKVNKETKAETRIPYIVEKAVILTGADLTDARVEPDPNSPTNWQVSVSLTDVGGQRFGDVTRKSVGRQLAIILDGNLNSAPVIREPITGGRVAITGQFGFEEAQDLKIVLRAGALPAPVTILEERTVGPSLGADSIRQGMIAILGSSIAVFLFMLIYYRLSGVIADIALVLNLVILLASMAAFGATLTLPGIAGIALTIGMAVDTNILIFERIREELRVGKSPRSAIEAGFHRALRTIIDTHLTVMVTAAILYNFGTGPVKGFAVSLFVGLAASLFTAYFFTRLLFDLIYMGRRKLEAISI